MRNNNDADATAPSLSSEINMSNLEPPSTSSSMLHQKADARYYTRAGRIYERIAADWRYDAGMISES